MSIKYNNDIQILRGYSILLVLLFHLNIPFFSNGYLGVDIFFVISGFLMFSLYQDEKIIDFYRKRANRILPAFFIVIFFVLIFCLFITNYFDFNAVIKQSIFSIFLIPNIGFWYDSSYFDKDLYKPLLHLWSLGIEIQFYILVPILFFLHKKIKFFLIFVFLISIIFCLLILYISPKTSFFIMPLRLWEFVIGAWGAILVNSKNIKNHNFLSSQLMQIIGIIFLLTLTFIPINPNSTNFLGHPGLIAFITCIVTLYLLVFKLYEFNYTKRIYSLLSWLGKYSYSIYLVHFPIIVLFNYRPFEGTKLGFENFYSLFFILSLIIGSAFLLYNFIEKKFRNGAKNNSLIIYISVPLIVLSLFFVDIKSRFYDDNDLNLFKAWDDKIYYRCGKINRIINPFSKSCNLTKITDPQKSIFLVGNSHADSIKKQFMIESFNQNMNLYFIVENNPLMKNGLTPNELIDEVIKVGTNLVFLHYSSGKPKIDILKKFLRLAEENNINIRYIMPVPTYEKHIPKFLLSLQTNKIGFKKISLQSKDDYLVKNASYYNKILNIPSPNFKIINVVDYFCDTDCKIVSDKGMPLYFDKSHLTLTGSKILKDVIKEEILSGH